MGYLIAFVAGVIAWALVEFFFLKRLEAYAESQVAKFKAYVESKLATVATKTK